MTAPFPALMPVKRPVILAGYQNGGPLQAMSGREKRVLLSSAVEGPEFQLDFVITNEADFLAVRDHYDQVGGEAGRFDVDPQTTGLNGTGAVPAVVGHQFRYVEPPSWTETCEAWFVEVVLSRAPAATATHGGGYFTWSSSFTPGKATGMSYPGAFMRSRSIFIGAPATGMSYPGANVTWTEEFIPGAFG